MKYSIAICDDARKDRELLRGFLGRWAGDRGFVSHNELWQAQAQYYAGEVGRGACAAVTETGNGDLSAVSQRTALWRYSAAFLAKSVFTRSS